MATVTKSFKLPASLAKSLAQESRQTGKSESELIREGIERVLAEGAGLDMQQLLAADLGVGQGPQDLSENRRHMAGYGRSGNR